MTKLSFTSEMHLAGIRKLKEAVNDGDVENLSDTVRDLFFAMLAQDKTVTVEETGKMAKQEAVAKVAELTNNAKELIKEAETIATEYGLSFSFSVAYGDGASFEDGEWNSSSSMC